MHTRGLLLTISNVQVRHGKVSPESDQLIKKMMRTTFTEDGVKATKLYATNSDVDAVNDRELKKLPGDKFWYRSAMELILGY